MKNITKTFFKKNFPLRKKDSYKNLNGKVLIIAGSAKLPGAAMLAAKAAYKAGAGFVTLAIPKSLYPAAVKAVPEALMLSLPETGGHIAGSCVKLIEEFLKELPHDLILIGPGLGKGADITLKLLQKIKTPAVIDADALNYLAKQGAAKIKGKGIYILTPHQGEIKRLLGIKNINPLTAANELYQKSGAVSLLKGPKTKVSYKAATLQNTTGNEGLAKAGSGDVLAGIIAGVFAQLIRKDTPKTLEEKAFLSAALGVYLHGFAADTAVKKINKTSLMASDVCNCISCAFNQIYK